MGKFTALADYCREQSLREFELSFIKIEALIGSKLPESSLRPQYWANAVNGTGPVRTAMRDTPYQTFLVVGSRRVRFERKHGTLDESRLDHWLSVVRSSPWFES